MFTRNLEQVPPYGDWKQPALLSDEERLRLFCRLRGNPQGEADGNVAFWDRKWIVLMNRYQEIQEKTLRIAAKNVGIADRKSCVVRENL